MHIHKLIESNDSHVSNKYTELSDVLCKKRTGKIIRTELWEMLSRNTSGGQQLPKPNCKPPCWNSHSSQLNHVAVEEQCEFQERDLEFTLL